MLMFRSFLTLGSGIVLHAILIALLTHLIGTFFFESYQEFAKLPADRQAEVFSIRPFEVIPVPMFWTIVVVGSGLNFMLGALTTRTAPFSYMAHAIFLAVLLFVFYLQRAPTEEPDKKFMTLVYMVCFSTAILLGGTWMSKRMTSVAESNTETDGERN